MATPRPRITIRTDTVSQVQSGNSGSLESEDVDQAPEPRSTTVARWVAPWGCGVPRGEWCDGLLWVG